MFYQLAPLEAKAYDPNLYLSTTAQATAALVAIIGGFLVSRLIGLVSEKTQQAQLFDELKSKRRVKDAELEKFNFTVVSGIQKLFREDYLDSILESKGDSNYTKMVDSFEVAGSDRQEIAEYANTLKTVVTRAFKELEAKYKEPAHLPESALKMRTDGIHIDPGHDEEIFERVSLFISTERQFLPSDSPLKPAEIGESSSERDADSLDAEPLPPPVHAAPTLVTSRHDAAIKERDRLKEELGVITGEIALLELRLPALAQQRWLIQGFMILAYFSAVGIVYPLFLMSRNPVVASGTQRAMVLLGFTSGLLALLAFIWSAVADLKAIEKGVGVLD